MRKPSFKTVVIVAVTALFLIAAASAITQWQHGRRAQQSTEHLKPPGWMSECDRTLERSLVWRQSAYDTPTSNAEIQRETTPDCPSDRWNPVIIDADQPGMCGRFPLKTRNQVGTMQIPASPDPGPQQTAKPPQPQVPQDPPRRKQRPIQTQHHRPLRPRQPPRKKGRLLDVLQKTGLRIPLMDLRVTRPTANSEVTNLEKNETEQRELERAVLDWTYTGRTGRSSEAIAYTAVKGTAQRALNHPRDPDDLRRCLLLLQEVPSAGRALPILAAASPFWAAIVSDWETLNSSLREEWGTDLSNPGWQPATKTYKAMRELLAPLEEEARQTVAKPPKPST